MICIKKDVLREQFGVTDDEIAKLIAIFPSTGLLPCESHRFNDRSEPDPDGKRSVQWLRDEPSSKKKLLLIGMSDFYGDGGSVTGHAVKFKIWVSRDGMLATRSLTDTERTEIVALFREYGWLSVDAAISMIMDTPRTDGGTDVDLRDLDR